MFVLEGKLTCASFHSHYNVVVGNVLVLVLEGNPTCVDLPSQWNIIAGNVLVLVKK